jgi:hypothetical protein
MQLEEQEDQNSEMLNTVGAPSSGPQRFTVSLDKPQILWSKTMDMIGIWGTSDRMIELHRVGYKH